MYVPMVTMTSRTTLLSKTLQIIEKSESNRNANILFANMVVTSPAIDLKPEHLPIFMNMLASRRQSKPSPTSRQHLMSRLLPKATMKFSIQEPVIRIVLPPTEPAHQEHGDMDMLISSLSSISVDLESSHEAEGQMNYMLTSTFRLTSHVLYYRTASGIHHDLLHTETFDLKAQLTATPEVQVVATAYLSTFSLRLVRPEVVNALKQLVTRFRTDYKPRHRAPGPVNSQNFVRNIPIWLEQFKLECNDFVVEIAGVDKKISETVRGVAFQMDSWAVDYKCRKVEHDAGRMTPRRRTASRTMSVDESRGKSPGTSHKSSSKSKNPTDGRKLSFHARGFEGFIVESCDSWEQDPFLQVPMFDIGFSTSTDHDGPLLNIASPIKSIFLNYSLYRHYSIIVAATVGLDIIGKKPKISKAREKVFHPKDVHSRHESVWGNLDMVDSPMGIPEFVSLDIKIQHIKLKASMPADPPMMVEMHGVDSGRRRWGFPFLKAKNFRLYAESPKVQKCWARLISLRHFRVDFRDMKRSKDSITVSEKSIDLCADAIRLAIPHQMILYKITDNVINTFKSCEQMHHQFNTGSNEYILDKKPEGPKRVPKVTLRTKALLFELEDDPFETKLGMIYRVGLPEQRKRLAREEAFEIKAKKLEDSLKRKSWGQERSSEHPQPFKSRGRTRTYRGDNPSSLRSDAHELKPRSKSTARSMRYDPDHAHEPTESATVSIAEAWAKLQQHNSEAWIKRIKQAAELDRAKMSDAREAFWGHDDMPSDVGDGEHILGLPLRPSLMACFFNDVAITLDKPSFTMEELPEFLHRVGKGLPKDTLFSLLVPVSIKIDFSEAKVLLRDYPLPFIHVPQLRPGQSSRLSSWALKCDFVIAEEYRGGPESMRHCHVDIVPPSAPGAGDGFSINVRRTVSAVKSYSDIKVAINSSYATRITWCTSYQPAIQDMMMVFETFTKPHVDPSERTGFWDKIRLVLHSQISLGWEGDGDVHLTLKGMWPQNS